MHCSACVQLLAKLLVRANKSVAAIECSNPLLLASLTRPPMARTYIKKTENTRGGITKALNKFLINLRRGDVPCSYVPEVLSAKQAILMRIRRSRSDEETREMESHMKCINEWLERLPKDIPATKWPAKVRAKTQAEPEAASPINSEPMQTVVAQAETTTQAEPVVQAEPGPTAIAQVAPEVAQQPKAKRARKSTDDQYEKLWQSTYDRLEGIPNRERLAIADAEVQKRRVQDRYML